MCSIARRTCLVVGLFFLTLPTLARPNESVPVHPDTEPPALEKQIGSLAPSPRAGGGVSAATGKAELGGVASLEVRSEREGEVAHSPQSPPGTREPSAHFSEADPYEQRLIGMRLSAVLSKRPVLASDPFDASASARIDIQQNEVSKHWLIDPVDVTLRQTLLRWSDSIGWQLIWETDKDFAIDARVELHTTFKKALETVMLSLADSAYPLQASLNRDARIVRVQRYMEQRAR